MDYVSTVVEKDKCRCYKWEKYHNSAQKNRNVFSLLKNIGIYQQQESMILYH